MSPRSFGPQRPHSDPAWAPISARAQSSACPWILWLLTLLFAVRVAAQAIQRWWPRDFLPPFGAFQGSHLVYPVLLTAQLLILAVMLRWSWKVQRGALSAGKPAAKTLFWIGGIYLGASLARLAIGLEIQNAPPWFRAWISGVFHLVLASFILTLAAHHRRASATRENIDAA